MSNACTWNLSREPSSSGFSAYPARLRLRPVKSWVSTIGLEVGDVGPQRCRVHRHEYVGGVAGRQDVMVGEVQLEGRHAGQGARGGPDLGGEVRQGREVIAEARGFLREPVAGQLHPVAGVTSEPDDNLVELLDLFGHVAHLLGISSASCRLSLRREL